MRQDLRPMAYMFALAVGACGGGSDAEPSYAELSLAPRQLEAEARALASDTPCQADANCSALVFVGVCFNEYAPLSLSSPHADRAVSLANEQRRLMEVAMRAPDSPRQVTSCAAPPPDRPAALCVQAQCTLR